MLYYPAPTTNIADKAADGQRAERVVAELTGCLMPPARSQVERLEPGSDAAALNTAMMHAHVDHLVDFYLVILAGTTPHHTTYAVRQSIPQLE